jgi:hypothetical protein
VNVVNSGPRMEESPLPEGCDGTDVSWHGSRPECQGVCAASNTRTDATGDDHTEQDEDEFNARIGGYGYDDYDDTSTENMPDDRSRKFMIVILGNKTTAGCVIRADVQVYALHQEHAEVLGEVLISSMTIGNGQVDSVYELI